MDKELRGRDLRKAIHRIRQGGNLKIEQTTNIEERDHNILSTIATMAETKAAMLTIKGRDSAMRATLERPTGRIRSKDGGGEARGEVTRNRKGTMLGR